MKLTVETIVRLLGCYRDSFSTWFRYGSYLPSSCPRCTYLVLTSFVEFSTHTWGFQNVLDGRSRTRRCPFLQVPFHPRVVYTCIDTFRQYMSPRSIFFLELNSDSQNFLLGTLFRNGGIAILLSALTALYQMTYAGFFVHLNSIPPVLRWLQWLCPLKYCLEALSVNEVGSGLMIQDSLQGVPVDVSASLIMNLVCWNVFSCRESTTLNPPMAVVWIRSK